MTNENEQNKTKVKSATSSSRKLESVIEGYLDYTKQAPSPYIFRRWAGISLVAACLTRRTWIRTEQGIIYPNSMILCVGNASTGKGPAIDPAESLLRMIDTSYDVLKRFEGIHIGPGDATVAGLFDEFLDDFSQKTYDLDGVSHSFSSVILIAEELSAMMHNLDNQMMGYLIKLLNCQVLSQRLRGRGETQVIERPVLHILGGVQPKMLSQIFPAVAFGMGLTARTTFVYSNKKIKVSPFAKVYVDPKLEEKLIHDMKRITKLTGTFKIHSEARDMIDTWWLQESESDKQDHPKLEGYNGKRILHLFRLCMIHCASRADHMVIELIDVQKSIKDLLAVEKDMTKIFQEMTGENATGEIFGDLAHEVKIAYEKTNKPIPYHILTRMVAKKVKSYEIVPVVEAMLNQKLIEEVPSLLKLPGGGGPRAFRPPKKSKT